MILSRIFIFWDHSQQPMIVYEVSWLNFDNARLYHAHYVPYYFWRKNATGILKSVRKKNLLQKVLKDRKKERAFLLPGARNGRAPFFKIGTQAGTRSWKLRSDYCFGPISCIVSFGYRNIYGTFILQISWKRGSQQSKKVNKKWLWKAKLFLWKNIFRWMSDHFWPQYISVFAEIFKELNSVHSLSNSIVDFRVLLLSAKSSFLCQFF